MKNKKDINKVKKLVQEVDGFLTDSEGEFLYNAAKKCEGKGVIVEIGSWKGKSTIWLASGTKIKNIMKIYAIDPHTGGTSLEFKNKDIKTFKDFKNNIKKAKCEKIVIPIVQTSEEASKNFKEPVEFIFIDGAHDYKSVKKDFDLWYPKLINGGTIAFHDIISWDGPTKVFKAMCKSKNFINTGFCDSIGFAQKVKCNSLKDRLKNNYISFLVTICNLLSKYLPLSIKKIGKHIINLNNKK